MTGDQCGSAVFCATEGWVLCERPEHHRTPPHRSYQHFWTDEFAASYVLDSNWRGVPHPQPDH